MKQVTTLYKNAYSGLSSSTWLLSFVMLVNRSGTMVLPFMTLYLTGMHYTITQAGVVVSLFGAGAVCGGFLGGKLTDKYNFYFIQLFTLVGGGIMFLVLGQMNSFPLICITTFLLSMINDAFRPANAAAIAHYSKEENRTRSYSLNRLAINLGWAVGGSLGGFIAAYNYHLLFWIDGFTNIFAGLLLWLFFAPSKNKVTAKASRVYVKNAAHSAYKDTAYRWFIAFTIVFAFCFFQLFSTVPVFYKTVLQLNEAAIGGVMALNVILIACVEMVLVYHWEGKRKPLQYIVYGVLLFSFSFMLFNFFTPMAWMAPVSMVLITFAEMLTMPFMNSFWTSRSRPQNRGQYAGLYTMAWSVAQVLGPVTGTTIAARYGFTTLWWFIAALGIVAAGGYRWLMVRKTDEIVKA
jgi:predicted MFS family arabinose efflux permease